MIDPASPYIHPRRSRRPMLLALAVALLIGGAIGAWIADHSQGRWPFGARSAPVVARVTPAAPVAPPTMVVASGPTQPRTASQLEAKDGATAERLAVIEDRIARLDTAIAMRTINEDRAEGLVIALAVRRAMERGLPLGDLAPQLRLQFADAHPDAVATIVAASSSGRSEAQLARRLQALERVSLQPPARGAAQRISDFFGRLIVLRPAGSPSTLPTARYDEARAALADRNYEAAIASVNALPGASDPRVQAWLADARRQAQLERALDVVEAAALRRGSDPANIPAKPTPAVG